MGVIIGIAIGVGALLLLNRQQLVASTSLQYGAGSAAPPRLNLPSSTFGTGGAGNDPLSYANTGFSDASAGLNAAKTLGASTSAIPIAGAVIGVVSSIVGPLIAAHKARIAGATSENSHNAAVTSLFDQAIAKIVAYWNQTHDQAGTISEIQQLDQYLYTTMKARVGAAGTAWDDATGQQGKCNKQCTAGCCIFWSDFRDGSTVGMNGLINAVRAGGRQSVTMPGVYPSKYSSFSRPSYTVTLA